jgi:hypothetical protein
MSRTVAFRYIFKYLCYSLFSLILSNMFKNRHLNPTSKAELSAVSFAESTKEVISARLATNLEYQLYCSVAE